MTIDIDAIRKREQAASEGPWIADEWEIYSDPTRDWIAETLDTDDPARSRADAAFIAHARTDVPALLAKVDAMRAVVDAAKYEYGDMWCLDGECDHDTESDDAPCPMVETRYATATEILAVKALLMSTDGDALGDDEQIPVGEIRRVLGEAREAVAR